MRQSAFRVAVATAAFGIVHSAFASRAAKRAAADVLGERNRNGLYRVFFNGQALICCGFLAGYIYKQPSRELYCIRGPLAYAMHAGQVAAVVYAAVAIHQIGFNRFIGFESMIAWLGEGPVPPEPEGQGPALDGSGISEAACPFAWSRHPLNFVLVPIFWLWPRMTTKMLAFNSVTTAYAILGSMHEERRLLQAYGKRYADYQASGVPFYVPSLERGAREPMQDVLREGQVDRRRRATQ